MLEVKKLKKKFGSNVVLNDISFNVSKGDIISIVGPSGSGKSTLLRCLNLIAVSYTHLVPIPNTEVKHFSAEDSD